MAPSAVTPPPQNKDNLPSTEKLPTTRKIVIFSDFDGTIFMEDTGHVLFNKYGCGSEQRERLEKQFKDGEKTFKGISEELWGSLDLPFDTGLKAIQEALTLDLDFKTFHEFCLNNNIPFNVISAGLKPILRRVLDHFLGEEASSKIEIIANDAEIDGEGHEWKPQWRHDTELGHDKALSINEYKDSAKIESEDGTIPMVIFVGDGVSDLAAASEADVLFARRGLALEAHCIEHNIKFYPYDTFADVQREVIRIAKIDEKKTKGQGLPVNFNPRANMWRRISSRSAVPVIAAATPAEERQFVWPEHFDEQGEKRIADANARRAQAVGA
ncbi:hypothetical protein Q7P35_009779 [Cladosporium inversicolor]